MSLWRGQMTLNGLSVWHAALLNSINMICKENCPRGTECKPISNVVADDNSSFVCVGYHNQIKNDYPQDRFRHCFKSADTDSMFDYDVYDLKSVISVMSEALLIDELTSNGGER